MERCCTWPWRSPLGADIIGPTMTLTLPLGTAVSAELAGWRARGLLMFSCLSSRTWQDPRGTLASVPKLPEALASSPPPMRGSPKMRQVGVLRQRSGWGSTSSHQRSCSAWVRPSPKECFWGRLLGAGAPEDSGRLVWPDHVWETRTGCPGPGMGKAGRQGGSTSSSHFPSSVFVADGEGLLAGPSSDLS